MTVVGPRPCVKYTIHGNVTIEKKEQMKRELKASKNGFIENILEIKGAGENILAGIVAEMEDISK